MNFATIYSTLAALALTSSPVEAQWIHQEQGSAFDTNKTQIALTAHGQYAVGLRCTSKADLTVIFITPETVDKDTVKMMNMASPEILVRVDQNEPHAFKSEGDNPEGKLTLHADAPSALVQELIDARSGVSVAARMLGSIFHETEFGARGSTASITKLAELCKLPTQ